MDPHGPNLLLSWEEDRSRTIAVDVMLALHLLKSLNVLNLGVVKSLYASALVADKGMGQGQGRASRSSARGQSMPSERRSTATGVPQPLEGPLRIRRLQ